MLRLVAAWVVVNGLLMAPLWVSAAVIEGPAVPWLALEAALLVGVMALFPRQRWSRVLAWGVAVGVVVLAAASFADLVFRVSLGRSLNLSVDLYLIDAVYRLAVGNIGFPRTVLGIAAIAAALSGSVVAIARLIEPRATPAEPRPAPAGAGTAPDAPRRRHVSRLAVGMIACASLLGLAGLVVDAIGERFVAPSVSLLSEQAALFRATREERATFAADLRSEPSGFADVPGLFSALEGRSVVVAYIESYGMAALEDPDFAAVVAPRLRGARARLEGAGLHLATGRFTSPTVGGQSWYAHGTVLSGLWLENQLRYQLLLASERETLVDDFRHAGYRTTTVMPAITEAWPAAIRLGYDDVFTAQNIPYAGPPLYWVTMPDQFTWAFVGGLLREATDPLFVEAGMVSSHAPWTPVVPILEWDAMGDGSVFEPYRRVGTPPDEVWWDVDVLREAYAQSLDYSLQAMAEFAERMLGDETLLIVIGDHQAAPWVTGASGSDVPVHVIARDSVVLEPFRGWGFSGGAFPDPQTPVRRLSEFRAWFVEAFSGAR